VINGKGGVGKTTLTANVGGLLAKSGYKVLEADMDPQGNLGLDLGYLGTERDDEGRGLASALLFGTDVPVVRAVRPNLDVLVGGDGLHHAQSALANKNGKGDPRDSLASLLAPIAGEYDIILIDCPPGSDALQSAAIAAARWVVVPARIDTGSQRGLEEVARRLDSVLDLNPDVDLLGVALFGVEVGATRVLENARQMIAAGLGSDVPLFQATIRHSSAVAQQARSRGLLVHELDEFVARNQQPWWKVRRGEATQVDASRTASNVADDLHALTIEMVARLTQREGQEVMA
jgi:cellulose biosynthesis protein BcsQ